MSGRTYLTGLGRLLEMVEASGADGQEVSIDAAIDSAVDMVLGVRDADKKAMLVGNGGSAALVSHMQNDLCNGVGVRAIVFTEQPMLTALANDHGYDAVFRKPVEMWAEPRDLLVAVSSSGESKSIITAVDAARAKGCRILTMSGFKPGNCLRQRGHLNFYVPHSTYGYVEMTHAILLHCVADFAMMRKPGQA